MSSDSSVDMLAAPKLERQMAGARRFAFRWNVERLTMLAAIDFRIGTVLLLDLIVVAIPSFQMATAKLAFSVFFIAGAHMQRAPFDFLAARQGGHDFRYRGCSLRDFTSGLDGQHSPP